MTAGPDQRTAEREPDPSAEDGDPGTTDGRAATTDAALPVQRSAEVPGTTVPSALEQPAPLPPREPPRWVRWTVVPLLVLVPIVYVLISAEQSRDSGVAKQKAAALTHLAPAAPVPLLQRIYQVPVPWGVTNTGVLETNSWDISTLYAQFTTTSGGLDTFLARVGTSRYALRPGTAAITPDQASTAGWTFPAGPTRAGIQLHQVGDKPDHDIVVDLSVADAPTIYVVSTVNFQHGFGGG